MEETTVQRVAHVDERNERSPHDVVSNRSIFLAEAQEYRYATGTSYGYELK